MDKRNNYDVENKYNYKNLNKYDEVYKIAKAKIAKKMRIEKIKKYLLSCDNEEIIFEVEKLLNERRKIQSN